MQNHLHDERHASGSRPVMSSTSDFLWHALPTLLVQGEKSPAQTLGSSVVR